MNVKRYPLTNKKPISNDEHENYFLEKSLSHAELAKTIKRAVKSVSVPIDLESKVLKLLRKQL